MSKTTMQWVSLPNIGAMLQFCAGKDAAGEAESDYEVESLLTKQFRLTRLTDEKCHVQWFTDGTAFAIISAVEQTGYCTTCASSDSYLGYFGGTPHDPS